MLRGRGRAAAAAAEGVHLVPPWLSAPGPGPGGGSGRISMAGLVCRKADAAHQQLGGNIVLVWDNYSHHVDAAMRELIGKRPWLTVFRFPRRLAVGQGRFR